MLRESERERGAFPDVVNYVLQNPLRKGLAEGSTDWPYCGACFPGYPKLHPRQAYFWENFWKAVNEQSD